MPYDEKLAARVRSVLAGEVGLSEKKMFEGLSFMVNGNMCYLMVRVGPDAYEDALEQRGAKPRDFTGRPMKSMVYVGPGGYAGRFLRSWVQRGLDFVGSLPAK